MNATSEIFYKKDPETNKNELKSIKNDETQDYGSYFRPDLNDEIPNFEEFLKFDTFNKDQIKDIQCILSNNVNEIPISIQSQIIIKLQNSFDNQDQNKNWRILWIFVYTLRNKEAFNTCYNPSICDILMHFISPTYQRSEDDRKCLTQSLFLMKFIVKRTNFRINVDQALFLLSLLMNESFDSNDKQLIIRIIERHLNINISDEIIQRIYQTAKALIINGNLTIQSLSLRLVMKILQKYQFSLPNDDLELFYLHAKSKHPMISIDAINVFNSYVKNSVNCSQIIEFRLIEKLLKIPLFENPNVSKAVFDVLAIISGQSEIGARTIYMSVALYRFFASSFAMQKSILLIIYNLANFKIISSLTQISDDTFEFVYLFLEAEYEEYILLALKIIQMCQSDLVSRMAAYDISPIDSLTLHPNEEISNNSRTLLNSITS